MLMDFGKETEAGPRFCVGCGAATAVSGGGAAVA
jgi:hypothetical protein